MELVYLWVEEYKNIKKQGVNFSPRFNCKYDEDANELTIDENDDYIDRFFGDNINVTAIVGKNGSGKSSILKLLLMSIFYEIHKDIHRADKFISPQTFDRVNFRNKKSIERQFGNKIFFVFKDNTIFKKLSILTSFKCNKEISIMKEDELDFFSIHFNYMLDTLYDGNHDSWVKEIYHKSDRYETPLLLEPYKNNNDKQQIDLDIIEYLNNQNLLRFYSQFNKEGFIKDFFTPDRIKFKIARRDFDSMNDEEFECKCDYFVAYKFIKLFEESIFSELEKEKACKICEEIQALYESKKYKELSWLYIVFKVLESDTKLFVEVEYSKIERWASENFIDSSNLLELVDKINLSLLIDGKAHKYEVLKIQKTIEFLDEKIYEKEVFLDNIANSKEVILIDDVIEILECIPPWIDVEWFENNKSLNSLSSGEKTLFMLLINIAYQVQNINNHPTYKTINLFLDEVELGFHPQWQKEYVDKIIKTVKMINIENKKINLFFATHSPFILSDLPKENIIFLEDGKQVQGTEKKQTFGANIHTLLSDSFFMEDGLMGEFAKQKINEIINFHKEVEKEDSDIDALTTEYKEKRDKFWDIQKVVGDSYLKQVLENHLVEIDKKLLGVDKAKALKIERVEAELKRLKDD